VQEETIGCLAARGKGSLKPALLGERKNRIGKRLFFKYTDKDLAEKFFGVKALNRDRFYLEKRCRICIESIQGRFR